MADHELTQPEQPLPRQRDIATNFIKTLETKGLIRTVAHEKLGVEAMGGTNETGDASLFEKVRNQPQAPNGYLIGVGFGNVLTMLEAYPEGTTPPAILLFDIDPQVIGYGQRMIQEMAEAPDYPPPHLDPYEKIFYPNFPINTKFALEKHRQTLQRLAKEGNLAIARVDFTNPDLIREMGELPHLREMNNLIYLSNIADHIYRGSYKVADFSTLDALAPNPPHTNYFVDTLQVALNYHLRIGKRSPHITSEDVRDIGLQGWQTRPLNLLSDEGASDDEANPLWEDIESWSIDQLTRTYHQMETNPLQQERKKSIEKKINEGMHRTLEEYPEAKRKALETPVVEPPEGRSLGEKYSAPTDPEEEQQVLAALSKSYSYDRQFIAFIAHSLWGDAKTPQEVDARSLPKYNPVVYENDDVYGGKRYLLHDPRRSLPGEVEKGYLCNSLSSTVTYEELVMAKLYREMERRALKRRPGASIEGKNFTELSREAVPPY